MGLPRFDVGPSGMPGGSPLNLRAGSVSQAVAARLAEHHGVASIEPGPEPSAIQPDLLSAKRSHALALFRACEFLLHLFHALRIRPNDATGTPRRQEICRFLYARTERNEAIETLVGVLRRPVGRRASRLVCTVPTAHTPRNDGAAQSILDCHPSGSCA